MDHTLASKTNTIDKYLMSELTHEERLAFEEHMFDCPECAERVTEDFAMIDGIKAVLQEPEAQVAPANTPRGVRSSWAKWFQPFTLAPAFAALALAVVVSYQNLVSIPGMLQPQVLDTTPMVAATRGAASQSVAVKPGARLFAVSFEVSSPTVYPAYVCEFQAEGNNSVTNVDCGRHSTAEFTLSLLLPSAKFHAGGYTMILRPVSDKQTEISRYSFAIKTEDR
jgi:hypothetical protein